MMADTIDPPDRPDDALQEPPVELTAIEKLAAKAAEALHWKTLYAASEARLAVIEAAAAAALARELDCDNPARDYKWLKDACADVGYSTLREEKRVRKWLSRKQVYGHYIGTHPVICINDLRDKIARTGRHAHR